LKEIGGKINKNRERNYQEDWRNEWERHCRCSRFYAL